MVLFEAMKACVLYFSQTGNTQRFAEAISESSKIPIFDIVTTESSVIDDFEVLIIGTPVHGFSPAKQVLSFVESLPEGKGKKAILFCTYIMLKGRTFKKLEKELKKKNYNTILTVPKKGNKSNKEDFSEAVDKIVKALN